MSKTTSKTTSNSSSDKQAETTRAEWVCLWVGRSGSKRAVRFEESNGAALLFERPKRGMFIVGGVYEVEHYVGADGKPARMVIKPDSPKFVRMIADKARIAELNAANETETRAASALAYEARMMKESSVAINDMTLAQLNRRYRKAKTRTERAALVALVVERVTMLAL